MTERQAAAAIQMWKSKRFSTWGIADLLGCCGAEVDRLVHRGRFSAGEVK